MGGMPGRQRPRRVPPESRERHAARAAHGAPWSDQNGALDCDPGILRERWCEG